MKSRLEGKVGKLWIGIIGGLVTALAGCILVSIFFPASSLDRMFAGGLLFGPLWVTACLAAYYAPNRIWAAVRVGVPGLLFIVADVIGLAS